MLYTDKLVDLAYRVASQCHRGQKDKSGKDYFIHCRKVAGIHGYYLYRGVNGIYNNETTPVESYENLLIIVGLLHDTIEDTDIEYEGIRKLFGKEVADIVLILTKRDDESYMDYIRRVKQNEYATIIKKRDLIHNMDFNRLDNVTQKDIDRNRKYLKAFEYLIKEDKYAE